MSQEIYFYGCCPEGRLVVIMSRCLSLCLSLSHVIFLKPLIGQKRENYIIEEVIEADEHDEGNLKLAAAGKQHK